MSEYLHIIFLLQTTRLSSINELNKLHCKHKPYPLQQHNQLFVQTTAWQQRSTDEATFSWPSSSLRGCTILTVSVTTENAAGIKSAVTILQIICPTTIFSSPQDLAQ